jgi:hypothetical protein
MFAKARELRALAGLIDGFLPPDIARQVRLANLREGQLVLLAANPAVAAKIKLISPSLIRFLAKQRWQVNSVSTRVQPSMSRAVGESARTVKSVHFSTASLAALRSLHSAMAPSPARQALGTLLEHHGAVPAKGPEAAPRKAGSASPPRGRARP